jgi:Flp pilus assembly protein TadG
VLNPQRGAAPVESIFAIVLLMVLVLGAIQVGLSLYGRNLVHAAAHEAARAGIERGASTSEAASIARSMIQTAGGRLVRGLAVEIDARELERVRTVRVRLTGTIDVVGPIPIPVPVDARATATSEGEIE